MKLLGDMTRRTILATLDPQCERPEERAFAFDPLETVKADRPKYVHSALTVLRAYHVAGRPQTVGPTGSFESWSKLVRAALIWLAEEDPWKTTEEVRGSDPKLEALVTVVEQWRNVIGIEPVTVRQVIDKATQRRPSTGIFDKEEFLYPDLREALLAVARRGGAISGRALGIWLGQNRGRIVAGKRLERHSIIKGSAHWRLMDA